MISGAFRTVIAGAALAAAALLAPSAKADPIADFYKGQDLTILIGHPSGGSYDIYAQLAARHIGKYIPGNPTVIVQSMPGGAGLKAAAYLYNKGPHDGSMIALFPETIAYVQLLDPSDAKWDLLKMSYIGSFAPVNTAFMVHKGGKIKSIADLKNPTNVGCSGRASQSFQYPAVLSAVGHYPFKLICGYDGSSAFTLALLRGEVDMVSKAWNAWRAEDRENIDNGTLIPILQGGLKRDPEISNVPLMQEVATDPTAKQALEFISSGAPIGRALLAPPGVPADRLAALRKAFDDVVKDPDLQADAKKNVIYLVPTPGTEVQKVSDSIVNTPKSVVDLAVKAFNNF